MSSRTAPARAAATQDVSPSQRRSPSPPGSRWFRSRETTAVWNLETCRPESIEAPRSRRSPQSPIKRPDPLRCLPKVSATERGRPGRMSSDPPSPVSHPQLRDARGPRAGLPKVSATERGRPGRQYPDASSRSRVQSRYFPPLSHPPLRDPQDRHSNPANSNPAGVTNNPTVRGSTHWKTCH